MKTKEKILMTSIELFNHHGVQAITTNHISKALNISPGNLYFHYDNKEAILRELYKMMINEMYHIWRPRDVRKKALLDFIKENFELFWKYRFFHRELYALRRKDRDLDKMVLSHQKKIQKLVIILYRYWVKEDVMIALEDPEEMSYVTETLLAMASTFLQFFESGDVEPGKNSLDRGARYVARFLRPYTSGPTRGSLESFLMGQKG